MKALLLLPVVLVVSIWYSQAFAVGPCNNNLSPTVSSRTSYFSHHHPKIEPSDDGNGVPFITLLRATPAKDKEVASTTEEKEDEAAAAAAASTTHMPDMKAFAAGYKTVFAEVPFRACTPSTGQVPNDLKGTYFKCGPAMFSAGSIVPPKTSIVQPNRPPVPDGTDPSRMVLHPAEGDGAILAVTFASAAATEDSTQQKQQQSQVTARYRYVRTAGFTNERKKGVRLYTGMDSTRQNAASATAATAALANDLPLPFFRHHLQPGLNKNRKNLSNTRAVYWGKRLLTLWEGGQPFKLDALALSTEGRTQLGGAIRKETDPFGCKVVTDPVKDRALFYGVEIGAKQSELIVYEFNSDFRLLRDGKILTTLPGCAILNDFAATENYAVFVQPPVNVNGFAFLTSKEPGKVLQLQDDRPATVHLIPRVESKRSTEKSFSIPVDHLSDANLQFVNAYETGDKVIVDAIRSDPSSASGTKSTNWPWVDTLEAYRAAATRKSLWRYTIDTRNGQVSKEPLYQGHCFFGIVNPAMSTQLHRYIYMNVGATNEKVAPPQGIAKFDCQTKETQVWMPKSYEFCGEPIYAPRQGQNGEDSGYILSVMFNGKKEESELIILEANNIVGGPITRIPLGVAVPHGNFGCFSDAKEVRYSFEEIQRRAKLADKMESRGNMWNEVKSDFSGLGLRFDGTTILAVLCLKAICFLKMNA